MSVHDQAVAAVLSQLALAADGAVLGIGLAYVALRSILKFTATTSALRKIDNAPSVQPSDLRSLLSSCNTEGKGNTCTGGSTNQSNGDGGKLVIVRGCVEAKSAVEGQGMILRGNTSNILVSQESREKGVILQRTQTYIYNEWRGFFGWTADLRSIFARSWKDQETSTIRTVPFVLVEAGRPQSGYVIVNMEGSSHPLPLTTVYHHLKPISASPYTFLQALFGHEYPVGLLDVEKILLLGKNITAVGICSLRNGSPEIKSCKDLPYFLSDLTKDQIMADLAFKTKVLLLSGVVFGSLAIGILGYAILRNWNRWKDWRQQRRAQQNNSASNDVSPQIAADEETGDIPDGELCVICLMRRRRSAFIPCGHMVCCQRCALSVEREISPKCPVCRQTIRNSVRIYDS
ncbi:E3 ubiquitin-protein ligase SPL2 [Olea europaea var. sylvestris]|uniref:E3 ubiquitin-protein ligase SPL2 n=1 Tax=Olea europaea var. sylvestris TaxID=158386 RepID=UPI000C1D4B59|nr:E3 ubiquitin-protein ligase SPL2 [Olea europaea var. sylvestris]